MHFWRDRNILITSELKSGSTDVARDASHPIPNPRRRLWGECALKADTGDRMEGKLEGRRACFLTSMHMRPSGCSERVHTESGSRSPARARQREGGVVGWRSRGRWCGVVARCCR